MERGYLKLITKSPFLFSEPTYSHMEHELKQRGIRALDFVCEAVGCKLQLAVTLTTLLMSRGDDEEAEGEQD